MTDPAALASRLLTMTAGTPGPGVPCATIRRLIGVKENFTAFVSLPGQGETRVRFRYGDGPRRWRCDKCGPRRHATCPHHVAALLAAAAKFIDNQPIP
jgi:hypothetical protein